MYKEHLLKLALYNLWANQKCCEFIADAGEERADLIQKSSFPTIRKTLYHIWDAEIVWIKRLHGQNIGTWPPSADFKGNLKEAMVEILNNSRLFYPFIEKKTDLEISNSLSYPTTNNKVQVSAIIDMIHHCFNHSTYHRGQIITLLHGSNYTKIDSTDFITYCRIQSDHK